MYEQHFGLTSPPFQLIPDPSFYYESRGHANALAYLKFGVYQGEGFIVVTGDIGAGKTTLLRTLMGSLDRQRVAAAHIVSTQLESGDLLRTILGAFGVPTTAHTKAEMLLALEGFLTALAARGRRALLVVDEAQNLSLQAVEELRMLSNFQLGNHALLQSFLVGQPELRQMLESPSLEQLRQRVIASCHLGPMEPDETKAYIEHRLRHVGWAGKPSFDDDALTEVHFASSGVPRRINLLCNRLLLRSYLTAEVRIDLATVRLVAQEWKAEVGERTPIAASGAGRQPEVENTAKLVGQPKSAVRPAREVVIAAVDAELASKVQGGVMVLVDTPLGQMKALAFCRALEQIPNSPPAVVAVIKSPEFEWDGADLQRIFGDAATACIVLGLSGVDHGFVGTVTSLLPAFDAVLNLRQPVAIMTLGRSDGCVAAVLLAQKRGIALARCDAGQRRDDSQDPGAFNSALLDRLSDALYTSRLTAHYALFREGIPADKVHNTGSLVADLLCQAMPHAIDPTALLAAVSAAKVGVRIGQGLALMLVSFGPGGVPPGHLSAVVELARAVNAYMPVVWAVDAQTHALLLRQRQEGGLRQSGVAMVPAPSYLGMLGLLTRSRVLLLGTQRTFSEEASALGVPCLAVAMPLNSAPEEGAPRCIGLDPVRAHKAVREVLNSEMPNNDSEFAPYETAARIADHLRQWLRKNRRAERTDARRVGP